MGSWKDKFACRHLTIRRKRSFSFCSRRRWLTLCILVIFSYTYMYVYSPACSVFLPSVHSYCRETNVLQVLHFALTDSPTLHCFSSRTKRGWNMYLRVGLSIKFLCLDLNFANYESSPVLSIHVPSWLSCVLLVFFYSFEPLFWYFTNSMTIWSVLKLRKIAWPCPFKHNVSISAHYQPRKLTIAIF